VETAASKVVVLPDSFTFEEGALIEPLSVANHAVARAGNLAGRNVAVVGGGPIGNLVAQVARNEGARVLSRIQPAPVGSRQPVRLDLTSNAGTENSARLRDARSAAAGFDVAFECVGVERSITAAVESIQKGGRWWWWGCSASGLRVESWAGSGP